jgi:hypothetical protein
MAYTQLNPHVTSAGRVEEISRESAHYRLSIPSGLADSYRLAQLDDYAHLPRSRFPHRAPLSLSLLAQTSSDSIPGTWGFGLWNDLFGLSLGFGGNPFRLPALPNAAWFFGASQENYLSFRSQHAQQSDEGTSRIGDEARITDVTRAPRHLRLPDTGPSGIGLKAHAGQVSNAPPANGGSALRAIAANGYLAQTFRAPKFHPLLFLAGLVFPFSRIRTRRLLGRVIEEDGINLSRRSLAPTDALESASYTASPGIDPTQWHQYRLEWREERVTFEVDNALVLESPVSPNPPLGLVIWIDNQYAAFTPEGKIGFGVLANPEPAWLEVKEIELKSL